MGSAECGVAKGVESGGIPVQPSGKPAFWAENGGFRAKRAFRGAAKVVLLGFYDIPLAFCGVLLGFCDIPLGFCDILLGFYDVPLGFCGVPLEKGVAFFRFTTSLFHFATSLFRFASMGSALF